MSEIHACHFKASSYSRLTPLLTFLCVLYLYLGGIQLSYNKAACLYEVHS